MPPLRTGSDDRGAATVEHAALVLLAAAVALAALAGARLLAREGGTPPLASELLRKQRCAVRHPGPCWQDPLTEAYGRAATGAVRALAPEPVPDAASGLVAVDYRRCRQARCATPLPGIEGRHLTVSGRRTVAFTSIREGGGRRFVDYWLYRPTVGWGLVSRELGDELLRALADTPLPDGADPKLVPLETLLGRDEARFAPAEQPPWRDRVASRWGLGP